MRHIPVLLMALLVTQHAVAQPPALPAFDVVSVKPSEGGSVAGIIRTPGRWRATDVTLIRLIESAYPDYAYGLIVDGPAWARNSRFTVDAATSTTATAADLQKMLARMLSDRFGLRTHVEKRSLDVYALKLAREDGRLGPNLVASAPECTAANQPRQALPASCERFRAPAFTAETRDSSLTSNADSISRIVRSLFLFGGSDRPIIDQTGLTGRYDMHLQYRGSFAPVTEADADGVTLFNALEEQLGLKLEGRRELLSVLVIDDARMPTPN